MKSQQDIELHLASLEDDELEYRCNNRRLIADMISIEIKALKWVLEE